MKINRRSRAKQVHSEIDEMNGKIIRKNDRLLNSRDTQDDSLRHLSRPKEI
jgi:hypothetical protein